MTRLNGSQHQFVLNSPEAFIEIQKLKGLTLPAARDMLGSDTVGSVVITEGGNPSSLMCSLYKHISFVSSAGGVRQGSVVHRGGLGLLVVCVLYKGPRVLLYLLFQSEPVFNSTASTLPPDSRLLEVLRLNTGSDGV